MARAGGERLAHSPEVAMRGSLIFLAACGAALACGPVRAADRTLQRPGWFGVFPHLPNYSLSFETPVVVDGKDASYSQQVRYDWMGNDFRQGTVTLGRAPGYKTRYAVE